MWLLAGEPHDISALALVRMQIYSRYLSTLGNCAATKGALGAMNKAPTRSGIEGC